MSWSSLVEDKLGAARRSVLRRVSASAPLGLLVRGMLALCAGAALSGVRLPGGSLPLGLALVAALPFGAVSVCALLGAVGAHALIYGFSQTLSVAAAGFLIETELLIFRELLPRDKRWFLPVSAAVLYGMVEFLELLQAHFAPDETLLFLARVGMLGVCAWAFTDAVTSRARGARVFLALCLLAGCGALVLPGGVRLSIVLGAAAVGFCLGLADALRAAALVGLALDVTGVCAVPLTPCFALAALLCGVLPLKTRLMRTVILLACCGGWLLLRQDVQVAGMAGCVLGGALALLLPQRLERFLDTDAPDGAAAAAPGLEQASALLGRIRRLLERTRAHDPAPQSAAVFDRAAELACCGCAGWETCWETCAADTYLALSGAAGRILQRGEMLPDDLPPFFRARCSRYPQFTGAVNQALDEQLARLQYQNRLTELSAVTAEQYGCLAAFLHGLAASKSDAPPAAFAPDEGFRACGVRGSSVCGDLAASFTCGERYYLLLCDGMGTGAAARGEAAAAAELLKGLICSGMDAPEALRMLSGVYFLRESGGFSTVDLLQVSLASGEGVLYKWGAAPSYLLVGRRVYKLGASAPPPGVSAEQGRRGQCIQLALQRGQTLILVSDGADEQTAEQTIRAAATTTPCELAAAIVAACGAEDDRSAAVVRLKRTRAAV